MKNECKEGEVIYATEAPKLKLIIRRYVDTIYFCKVQEDPERKELVYFEREFITEQRARISE